MRALVTGAAGYIGSHLCKRLKEDGWGVVGLDVRRALSPYIDHHIMASLVDRTALATTLRNIDFDIVFHLGALIDVAEGERLPLDYYRTNLGGTLNMIDFSEGKPIVFSSTAAVYASSSNPLSETSEIAPENVYGATKASAERLLRYAPNRHAILRYFNVAGCAPDIPDNHAEVTHLIARIVRDKSLTIHGNDYATRDGTCLRDYVHVLDLCDAHVKAAERLLEGKPSFVANLGSGTGYTVLEVAQAAQEELGIPVEYGPRRSGDPDALVADISVAKELLGFSPQYSLRDMIRSHRF
jgi:UDP-glucose 4-epimerase